MFDIQIIYEDDNIVVINKPAGLIVHPSLVTRSTPQVLTLVDWLVAKYPEIRNVGDESGFRPGIVHRLDKDTSGVLVVAKNQRAFEFLKEQFQSRTTSKKYIVLVNGEMKNDHGIINLPISKSKNDFRKKVCPTAGRAGGGKTVGISREAVTEYKVTKRFSRPDTQHSAYTLVEVFPKTGRTHQIRVHLKAIGHPVVCDKLYGSKNQVCPFGLARQFLHANFLELTTPVSSAGKPAIKSGKPAGARLKFEADLPEDLEAVLTGLRNGK